MSNLRSSLGLTHLKNVYHNLPTPLLYEEIVKRDEGFIAHMGPIVVNTGAYTGRSPSDKFIVREPSSEQDIWWEKSTSPSKKIASSLF
jgi:phosphoenolpyruvate carboxykinase (ATP)